jgi:hypothetical protein
MTVSTWRARKRAWPNGSFLATRGASGDRPGESTLWCFGARRSGEKVALGPSNQLSLTVASEVKVDKRMNEHGIDRLRPARDVRVRAHSESQTRKRSPGVALFAHDGCDSTWFCVSLSRPPIVQKLIGVSGGSRDELEVTWASSSGTDFNYSR